MIYIYNINIYIYIYIYKNSTGDILLDDNPQDLSKIV